MFMESFDCGSFLYAYKISLIVIWRCTMFKKSIKTMCVHFYWFYSLLMVGWDENATKVTNVTSKNKLMVASYCDFTIFLASTNLIVHVIFVVTTTCLATILFLLLLSNPPFQTFKYTYPWKLANDENSNIPQRSINIFINLI